MVAFGVTLWMNYRYAPDWYADALRAASEHGSGGRRREIIFSVCFADSYLAEWVIFDLGLDFEVAIRTYLPPGDKTGVADRWKDIPKALQVAGEIPGTPHLGDQDWLDWLRLVEFRNGLIHANASRPATAGLSNEWLPFPSLSDLNDLEPGWAVRVVADRVRRLHEAAETEPPIWLVGPPDSP